MSGPGHAACPVGRGSGVVRFFSRVLPRYKCEYLLDEAWAGSSDWQYFFTDVYKLPMQQWACMEISYICMAYIKYCVCYNMNCLSLSLLCLDISLPPSLPPSLSLSLVCYCLPVGLDAAGKTTILYKLKLGEIVTTIPTIGKTCTHTIPALCPPVVEMLYSIRICSTGGEM